MANIQAPFGFRQFRRLDGGAPTAGFDTLTIASSDTNVIGTGDMVQTAGSSTSLVGNYVTAMSSGLGRFRGIFLGCEFFSPSIGRKVWSPFFTGAVQTSSGTNDVQAWVCTDPEMLYIAQGSTSGAIGSSLISLNIGISSGTIGGANTTTGLSVMTLASSTADVTATLPWRIIDVYSNSAPPGTNGTDNTSAGNIVIVAPNNCDRNNTTGV